MCACANSPSSTLCICTHFSSLRAWLSLFVALACVTLAPSFHCMLLRVLSASIGLAYKKLGNFKEACVNFVKLNSILPGNSQVLYQIGDLYPISQWKSCTHTHMYTEICYLSQWKSCTHMYTALLKQHCTFFSSTTTPQLRSPADLDCGQMLLFTIVYLHMLCVCAWGGGGGRSGCAQHYCVLRRHCQ